MGRGPESQESKLKKLLAQAAEFLGEPVQLPLESRDDLIREAQSALNYFTSKGKGFKRITCSTCNLTFAYDWHYAGIKYCSLPCAKKALQKIGLDWDTSKPIEERWGLSAPAVVPPQTLLLLDEVLSSN